MLLGHLAAFTGAQTLSGLARFLIELRGMYAGFKERAARVEALLASEQTAFVLVVAPDAPCVDEALHVYGVLRLNGIDVAAVVANRVHPDWRAAAGGAQLTAGELEGAFDPDLARRLAETVAEQAVLADAHRAQLAALEELLEPGCPLATVPLAEHDVHAASALAHMAHALALN
jgi:anion-transporting  ArsA/GET3 family ATPase